MPKPLERLRAIRTTRTSIVDAVVTLAEAARPGAAHRRPVRGALHAEPRGRPAALRGAPRPTRRSRPTSTSLLSMRDDFLLRLQPHEALQPVVSPSSPCSIHPTGGALRRALVQPATKCGYRFEDDELVDEMLAEVEGERGALPLLAFALARLWEKRDRETGLLTRQAYQDIGGVGGALARHAEATIDRIGVERIPIVRELFRNLVTAEGTRAVREWDELLSVFERSALPSVASEELGVKRLHRYYTASEASAHFLTPHPPVMRPPRSSRSSSTPACSPPTRSARTSTSPPAASRSSTSRCSPTGRASCAGRPRTPTRAQLRDQLRQAARTWDEHDRSDDLLWTGTAYREFAVWRERYPGGLTETRRGLRRRHDLARDAPADGVDGSRRRPPSSLAHGHGVVVRHLVATQRPRDPPRRGRQAARPGPGPARDRSHRGAGLRHRQPRARRHPGGAAARGGGAVARTPGPSPSDLEGKGRKAEDSTGSP